MLINFLINITQLLYQVLTYQKAIAPELAEPCTEATENKSAVISVFFPCVLSG